MATDRPAYRTPVATRCLAAEATYRQTHSPSVCRKYRDRATTCTTVASGEARRSAVGTGELSGRRRTGAPTHLLGTAQPVGVGGGSSRRGNVRGIQNAGIAGIANRFTISPATDSPACP